MSQDPGGSAGGRRSGRRRPEPPPLQRALGLLVRREHSQRELAGKLAARGVPAAEAAQAVARLAAAGWQDDRRFAESLLRARLASGHGPAWVRAELATHGLGADLIAEVVAACPAEEWEAAARRLLRRRHGPMGDLQARRKAHDLLLRRGFGRELAAQVLAERAAEDEDMDAGA